MGACLCKWTRLNLNSGDVRWVSYVLKEPIAPTFRLWLREPHAVNPLSRLQRSIDSVRQTEKWELQRTKRWKILVAADTGYGRGPSLMPWRWPVWCSRFLIWWHDEERSFLLVVAREENKEAVLIISQSMAGKSSINFSRKTTGNLSPGIGRNDDKKLLKHLPWWWARITRRRKRMNIKYNQVLFSIVN